MITGLIGWMAGSCWVLTAAKWGAVGLTVLLFLLSIRRAGERAGRMVQRLETMDKAHDVQRRMLDAAARRPRDRSELARRLRDERLSVVAACPPVVEYGAEFRARAVEEFELLPEGSAIVEMLGDYAVMREQARVCERT